MKARYSIVSTGQARVALLLSTMLLVSLAGCGLNETVSTAEMDRSDSSDISSLDSEQAGQAPKGRNRASRQAAEQYSACLAEQGVDTRIVDDSYVVFQVEGEGSAGSSLGDERQRAVDMCLAEVPDYHDPDFDSR